MPPPVHSEFCTLVEPHRFADATIGFFGAHRGDPAVAADLDWISDIAKLRRCLCPSLTPDAEDPQARCPAT